MQRFRRPSPATVVACLALVVALGGTGIAATIVLAPNSVGTAQLKNNAVTGAKVANGTLLKADFKTGQLRPASAGPAGPPGAAGATGPAGPSSAYARFLNGPIAVPMASATLANLTIPQEGKYVLWAKAYFQESGGIGSASAICQLVAGTDTDQSAANVSSDTYFNLTTMVVHEFPAAGSADFKCAAVKGTMQANFIKITAIKVGNLTNSG